MVKAQRNPYGLVDPYDKSGSNTKWNIPRNSNILVKKWSKDNERNAITKCGGSPIGLQVLNTDYGISVLGGPLSVTKVMLENTGKNRKQSLFATCSDDMQRNAW